MDTRGLNVEIRQPLLTSLARSASLSSAWIADLAAHYVRPHVFPSNTQLVQILQYHLQIDKACVVWSECGSTFVLHWLDRPREGVNNRKSDAIEARDGASFRNY